MSPPARSCLTDATQQTDAKFCLKSKKSFGSQQCSMFARLNRGSTWFHNWTLQHQSIVLQAGAVSLTTQYHMLHHVTRGRPKVNLTADQSHQNFESFSRHSHGQRSGNSAGGGSEVLHSRHIPAFPSEWPTSCQPHSPTGGFADGQWPTRGWRFGAECACLRRRKASGSAVAANRSVTWMSDGSTIMIQVIQHDTAVQYNTFVICLHTCCLLYHCL